MIDAIFMNPRCLCGILPQTLLDKAILIAGEGFRFRGRQEHGQ